MAVNKYGLPRRIPDPVKREIRQRSGFGCIFCGIWIYQYEHIIPTYANSRVHDPLKICLLCGTEHQKVTSKIISKSQVQSQYEKPIALSQGYANDYLKLNQRFYVAVGRVFFASIGSLLRVDGEDLLNITQPTSEEPLKLNAKFYDDNKNLIMEVKDNEMIGYSTNWDIEQKGSRTIFRRKKGEIVLQINILPPDVIEIEKINMKYGSAEIFTDAQTGRIFIKAKNGGIVDLFKGQIVTEGLTITETGVDFNKGMIIGVQEGLELGKMDYRTFIDEGRFQSESLQKLEMNKQDDRP